MKTKKHFWNNAPVDTAFHLMNYFILIVILLVCAYPLLVIISSSVSDADYVNRGLVTFFAQGLFRLRHLNWSCGIPEFFPAI